MANKNTKQLRRAVRSASIAGLAELQYEIKTNHGAHVLVSKRVPTAVRGAGGVISASPRRNMRMVVLHNSDAEGKSSLTVHEPIDKSRFIKHKNHAAYTGFPQYKQAMQTSSRPSVV